MRLKKSTNILKIEEICLCISLSILFISCINSHGEENLSISDSANTIISRINPPENYQREQNQVNTWKYFLQNLKLKEHNSDILDYTGNPISNQSEHIAIVDYEVGTKDLQQCADAIIRLRAEYLYAQKRENEIQFHFTSGHLYKWIDHANGIRPEINGNKVNFKQKFAKDDSYKNFRNYLDIVFMYAGTISLNRNLKKKKRSDELEIGDIIVSPGSPGHAVIIADKAVNAKNGDVYLLVQGFMPAQSIHVIDSRKNNIQPWFSIPKEGSFDCGRYYFTDFNIVSFE